jgi:hypothetical protein
MIFRTLHFRDFSQSAVRCSLGRISVRLSAHFKRWERRLKLISIAQLLGRGGHKKKRRLRQSPAVWRAAAPGPSAGKRKQVLAVGQSHLNAWANAARMLMRSGRFPADLGIAFIQLRNAAYQPNLIGETQLNPALKNTIQDCAENADVLFCNIGGNAHNVLGLINHPRPYDFVLDVDPTIPVDPGKEILPCAIVRATLEKRMEEAFHIQASIREIVKIPMIYCEPPPPIPSEAHIREHPGKFAEKLGNSGIAPASFRLKLWKLQSDIQRRFCQGNNIGFLPSPPETADDSGMLAQRAWGRDPTHGNQWYGRRVIAQMRAYANGTR